MLKRLKDPRFGLRLLETAYVVTVEDKEVFSPKSKVSKLQTSFPRILERISMRQQSELLNQGTKGKFKHAKTANENTEHLSDPVPGTPKIL